jgi:excinuclease ABC subunit A
MLKEEIIITRASTHNLQRVSCVIPHGTLCCLTGVSGSGKSSLAFDTIFIEGQRRYVQSLSHQAKRIIGELPKPEVESIDGLTPTIAIEQKSSRGSSRSTVGTLTEIYDYLRVIYAKIATPYCPISHEPLISSSRPHIVEKVFNRYQGQQMTILAPWKRQQKGEPKDDLAHIERKGFSRIRLDGTMNILSDVQEVDPSSPHDIDIVVDRITIGEAQHTRIVESLHTALDIGKGLCIILDTQNGEELFSEHAYSKASGISYPPLEPHDFSSNTPLGMCPQCQGLGACYEFVLDDLIDEEQSIANNCCSIAGSYQTIWYRNIYDNLASMYNFSVHTPWKKLPEAIKHLLLYGTERRWTRMVFINPNTGSTWADNVQWRGILYEAKKKYLEAKSESYKQHMEQHMRLSTCHVCSGSGLKPYPAAARLFGLSWLRLTQQTVDDTRTFFTSINLSPEHAYAQELIDHVTSRLTFLQDVGLGYLTLSRPTTTLSGGEFQRVRLASHIGSGLTGITYVLDEPSIGLHPVDNDRLIHALQTLRDRGNTVIVVEHDEQMMRSADWILDFGPGAGSYGGSLLYQGPLSGLEPISHSATSDYLFGRSSISAREGRLLTSDAPTKFLRLTGACHRNVDNVDLTLPLERFVAITGVSGSGKSSLIFETLLPALSHAPHGRFRSLTGQEQIDGVVHIDQSPIGRTPRSTPATYCGVFDHIRNLFASLPASKARGWTAGRFSFNVKEGSCHTCQGTGHVAVDMDFLETAYVLCPTCHGRRFDAETLSVRYKGHSILDVLTMTCREAYDVFNTIPSIAASLETLMNVGLDYIKLGQSATTLSGGEAQRLKLAKELARPAKEKMLYLFDEPTTGLHAHDIARLLNVLHALVARGHSVVVIEHNMDLVQTADWVIDMGPGAGVNGGKIIAEGTPQAIAQLSTPTGLALHRVLSPQPPPQSHKSRPQTRTRTISIHGARQHTLKNLSLEIPNNAFTAIVGPSGSGKSSLACDTLFAEGQRQYIESLSPYARQYIRQQPKAAVDAISGLPPPVAGTQRDSDANPRSTIGTITEIYDHLRVLWAHLGTPHCPKTGEPIIMMTPDRIADTILSWETEAPLVIAAPIPSMTSATIEAAIDSYRKRGYSRIRINGHFLNLDDDPIPSLTRGRRVRLDIIIDRLRPSPHERGRLLASIEEACQHGDRHLVVIRDGIDHSFSLSSMVTETGQTYDDITAQTFAFNTHAGMCPECEGLGQVDGRQCRSCKGTRLNPVARYVTIGNYSIADFSAMPVNEARSWFRSMITPMDVEKPIRRLIDEIDHRLALIDEFGVGYLSLDRQADTLSKGESHRIRLASQVGSKLSGLLYVLEEPSTGLHPADAEKLMTVFSQLQARGNTIVAVDHDPNIIEKADHIVELGLEGGSQGGHLVFQGTHAAFTRAQTPTSTALQSSLCLNDSPPSTTTPICLHSVSCHNLHKFSCSLPTQSLVGIVGVSGSGKSTLLFDVIAAAAERKGTPKVSGLESFGRTITIDQRTGGHTPRSDIASYTDLATPLRRFFASLPQAKALGLDPSHFSAFHHKGWCKSCCGMGYRTIDMHLLPPARVPCDACHGLRLNPVSLSVEYRGYNVGQILTLSVAEAKALFEEHWKIVRILDSLIAGGLQYLVLGQEMVSLSTGEIQRVILAKELSRSRVSTTLYLMDEPSTGLHAREVSLLIQQLRSLVCDGATVVVVEHHLDLIAACDHLLELGPGAGPHGGTIVAQGSPKQLAQHELSPTGRFLRERNR